MRDDEGDTGRLQLSLIIIPRGSGLAWSFQLCANIGKAENALANIIDWFPVPANCELNALGPLADCKTCNHVTKVPTV